MKNIRYFLLICIMFVLYACNSQKYFIQSYTDNFTISQIDSIFKAEKLPTSGWLDSYFVDDEDSDTIYSYAFYKEIDNDSIKGIKYLYRKIDNNNYFSKQIIYKNK